MKDASKKHPAGLPEEEPVRREKFLTRKRILEVRDNISAKDRAERSAEIRRRVLETVRKYVPETLHLFLSFGSEPDTLPLLEPIWQMGIKTVVPVVLRTGIVLVPYAEGTPLKPGPFGIGEPPVSKTVSPDSVDLFLLPGIAFDRSGGRLGYGKGYYDRLLTGLSSPRIALAFHEQIIDRTPLLENDILVDAIITDKEIIHCARSQQN
ncbi:MAG: 5-formyltetrahydrofolate cyclo-ligase [Leptospirillum sp.]